jgi:uncharacterized protein
MTSANGEPTIKTFSGITLNFIEPAPKMIEIPDIAHGLSNVCRFAGQSSEFYSVAQHSVLVSRLVPPGLAKWGLLHDAAEAYIGDMARPLKRLLPEYKKIEVGIMRVIAFRFDLEWPEPPEVKNADIYALALEGKRFMAGREDEYGIADMKVSGMAVNALYSMTPADGKRLFMDRFKELFL